jgi:tRNA(adenine34) deaminase
MYTPQREQDGYWMQHALTQAKHAYDKDEVPIGAVLVRDGTLISQAHNLCITNNDPSAHAEMLCLREAGAQLSNYRIPNATLFVTIEPCMMCLGALVNARIERLVFGAPEPKTGCIISHNLTQSPTLNHSFDITPGVLEYESRMLMKQFFSKKRKEKKELNTPIPSPCVSVCALDSDDICVGCYRSVDEIRDWSEYDNSQKKQVISKAQQRSNAMWSL